MISADRFPVPLAAGDAWLIPVLRGLLAPAQLEELLRSGASSLWQAALESRSVDPDALLVAAAAHARLPAADATSGHPAVADLISERWARRFGIVPLHATDATIDVATSNPYDADCERAIGFATGRRVQLFLASPDTIERQLDALYGAHEDRWANAAPDPAPSADVQHLAQDTEGAPDHWNDDTRVAAPLVDRVLAAGIHARASDIHIEPEERGIVVRHRVDGVLREASILPRAVAPSFTSRVKILAGLDIADRLRPQDGRARVAVNGRPVDLRISTLPAARGEKIVIRVLDARATVLGLDEMGFGSQERARLTTLLQAREGLILLTGPTGSGKTTTLYAAVREIASRGVNIVTVEDPVEYRIPGIVQVQVHERSGLTFAAALRSIMRQDPDVILVGEIRDRETAEIAIQASLTGHLVLSTLHTNDAASAVTRLVDIGVERHKIGTALKGVVAQRLLRRLCTGCRSVEPLLAARAGVDEGTVVGTAGACQECGDSGYAGRLAIAEVLLGSRELEALVAAGATAEQLAECGRAEGMLSLWESGLEHVRRGVTSLDELLRVAEPPRRRAAAGESRQHYIPGMTEIKAGTVDVFVIRPLREGWRVLVLQRGEGTRCTGSWETVHGRIEEGERPEQAAVREVREESGLEVERLYSIGVQPFYLLATHTIQVGTVFAAFVGEPATVTLGEEHATHEWLAVDEARRRFAWPAERSSLDQVVALVGGGDAGPLEDVLRVKL